MHCVKPVRITRNLNPSEFPDGLLVPCGKCIACRMSKRREWSMRMLHELSAHEDSIFITLTYDNDHLPLGGSLIKVDLQKFFKRLRRRLDDEKRKIKYFACGEYGERTHRPHYHAIIFGMSLSSDDKDRIMESWPFSDWSNPVIRRNCFGLAEVDSIRYVAQYIDKKFTGDKADEEYINKAREPVFRLCSTGLGLEFCKRNSESIIANKALTLNGVKMSVPRYYLEKLGIDSSLFKEYAVDSDCEVTEHYIGRSITDDEAYRTCAPEVYRRLNDGKQSALDQHRRNLEAKVRLKESKL